MRRLVCMVAAMVLLASCMPPAQRGGNTMTTLGGGTRPTTVVSTAPENPQTPSTTTVEKTSTRVYHLPRNNKTATEDSQGVSTREQPETGPRRAAAQMESRVAAFSVPDASPASTVEDPGAAAPGVLVSETVTERATTSLGSSWRDTARELGVKLANLRGVLWVGIALLIVGPIVGFKLGWFTNGLIAGAVGLLLIILSQIIPGNEAWFGLAGLLLIPLVAFVYYRAHHDATQPKQ